MARQDELPGFRTRFANRWQAKRATRARPATGFVSQPEPRTIGSFARGKQLISGNYLFAGHLVNAPDSAIWDITPPSRAFSEELQGFVWLDDLASLGDLQARQYAQDWTLRWIYRFGNGSGDGWTPDLTGRRLIRWISHAIFLMRSMESDASMLFFRSLGQQTIFLSRRWQATAPGLARFEALTGLVYAGLSLTGMERHVDPALAALARECENHIDQNGGIPTRNPEELLSVFTLLNWAAMALAESDRKPAPEHLAAIERIAPTLRALRHADGGLARFHGGGRGLEGRLDHALANSGVRASGVALHGMGYSRISGGRTSIIVDTAQPPTGVASSNAHASTLAFELTSGRRPLVVDCGSGAHFGEDWHKAGRATPSHSVLGLTGLSSSRLANPTVRSGIARTYLEAVPSKVHLQRFSDNGQNGIVAAHDGYLLSHGLTQMRRIALSADGRDVSGEDTLAAVSEADQSKFDAVMDRLSLQGIAFSIRFHLHPDVDATLDMGGTAVSMALRSGEVWVFRFEGNATMSLENSVYLEKTRLKPRKAKQVVLTGAAMDYATRIRWTLAKAQETPSVMRDLEQDGSVELPS